GSETPPVVPAASRQMIRLSSVRAALRGAAVIGGTEARTTTARGDRVRVVHRETGAHQRIDVVDFRALQERDALAVDVHLDAARVQDVVLRGRGILEHHAVAEARAPAGVDVYP